MKKSPALLLTVCVVFTLIASQESQAQRGRSVNATREGARGGSVTVEGQGYGRFGAGSVNATGPNGGSYEASGVRAGRYRAGSVNATGPRGGTYNASAAGFRGYRSGYVYTGGAYRPATVTVNSLYVAPVGAYAGWKVLAQPYYVSQPVYATYPVEVSVQVELQRRGFYKGSIDGMMGPGTSKAISRYQAKSGLQVTGTINRALLVSLGIVKA
jgi:hypothetical protein